MVDGIPELKARFKKIEGKLLKAGEPALLEGGEKIVAAAKALAPKKSGRLAATIRSTGMERTRNHGNPMVRVLAGEGYIVGKSAKWNLARIIEYGTKKQRAEPFLRPSARRLRGPIRAAVRRAIMQAILEEGI